MLSTAVCTFQRRTMLIIQKIRNAMVRRLRITKQTIKKVTTDSGMSGSLELPPNSMFSCDWSRAE